jgi:hypothetical protein
LGKVNLIGVREFEARGLDDKNELGWGFSGKDILCFEIEI